MKPIKEYIKIKRIPLKETVPGLFIPANMNHDQFTGVIVSLGDGVLLNPDIPSESIGRKVVFTNPIGPFKEDGDETEYVYIKYENLIAIEDKS